MYEDEYWDGYFGDAGAVGGYDAPTPANEDWMYRTTTPATRAPFATSAHPQRQHFGLEHLTLDAFPTHEYANSFIHDDDEPRPTRSGSVKQSDLVRRKSSVKVGGQSCNDYFAAMGGFQRVDADTETGAEAAVEPEPEVIIEYGAYDSGTDAEDEWIPGAENATLDEISDAWSRRKKDRYHRHQPDISHLIHQPDPSDTDATGYMDPKKWHYCYYWHTYVRQPVNNDEHWPMGEYAGIYPYVNNPLFRTRDLYDEEAMKSAREANMIPRGRRGREFKQFRTEELLANEISDLEVERSLKKQIGSDRKIQRMRKNRFLSRVDEFHNLKTELEQEWFKFMMLHATPRKANLRETWELVHLAIFCVGKKDRMRVARAVISALRPDCVADEKDPARRHHLAKEEYEVAVDAVKTLMKNEAAGWDDDGTNVHEIIKSHGFDQLDEFKDLIHHRGRKRYNE